MALSGSHMVLGCWLDLSEVTRTGSQRFGTGIQALALHAVDPDMIPANLP